MAPLKDCRGQKYTHRRGRSAEQDGIGWLEGQGFLIVDRNVRFRAGEIDVVALDGDTLCFVEVKARSGGICGDAVYAVTPRKQKQLARLASLYLLQRSWDGPVRFDVMAMDGGDGGWRYTLYRNAFEIG